MNYFYKLFLGRGEGGRGAGGRRGLEKVYFFTYNLNRIFFRGVWWEFGGLSK